MQAESHCSSARLSPDSGLLCRWGNRICRLSKEFLFLVLREFDLWWCLIFDSVRKHEVRTQIELKLFNGCSSVLSLCPEGSWKAWKEQAPMHQIDVRNREIVAGALSSLRIGFVWSEYFRDIYDRTCCRQEWFIYMLIYAFLGKRTSSLHTPTETRAVSQHWQDSLPAFSPVVIQTCGEFRQEQFIVLILCVLSCFYAKRTFYQLHCPFG